MADKTYDINISGVTGSTGGGGQKPPNTASLNRLLKAIEALVRGQKTDIAKDLKPLFEKLITQITGQQVGSGPKKVTQAEVRGIANDLASEVARQISRQLTKVYANAKSPAGGAGTYDAKRTLDVISRGLDKQAQAIAGQLNTALSRKGVSIDQQDMKALEQALSGSIKRIVTTKAGGEVREVVKAANSMKNAIGELSKLVKIIGGIRKSGGGIDLTEIRDAVTTIGKVNKELKTFKDSASNATAAIRRLPGDVKNIKDALVGVKSAVGKQVGGVRTRAKDDPRDFARLVAKTIGDTLEKSPTFRQSDAGKSWHALEKTANNMKEVAQKLGDISKDIAGTVKAGEVPTQEINKLITLLSKNITPQPATRGVAPGWYNEKEPPKAATLKAGKKIVTTLEKVNVEVDISKAKKEIDALSTYAGKTIDDAVSKSIMKGMQGEPIAEKFEAEAKKVQKAFEDTFKAIDKAASGFFTRAGPITQGVHAARSALRGGDVQGAMHKTVQTIQIAEMPSSVKKPLEELKQQVVSWNDKMRAARFDPGVAKEWIAAYEDLTAKTKEVTAETKELKKETVKVKEKISKTGKAVDGIKKELDNQVKASTKIFGSTDFSSKGAGLLQEKRARFLSSQPQKIESGYIEPGVKSSLGKPKQASYGKQTREDLQENVDAISMSLDKLQKEIISELDKGFEASKKGWVVLDRKFKRQGDQWKLKIADLSKLSEDLGENIPVGTTPAEILKQFEEKQTSKIVARTPLPLEKSRKIGEWLKNSTMKSVEGLREGLDGAVVDILQDIKSNKGFIAGEEVSSELAETINNRLGTELASVFEKTFAKTTAKSSIIKNKLTKEITLPAAQKSESTGTSIFKTKHGSERAIPKFATYKTGFEEMYDVLQNRRVFAEKEEYEIAKRIQKLGFRPEKTGKLKDAKKLATDLFKTLSAKGQDDLIVEQYREATTMVGAKRQRAGVGTIADFEKKTNEAIENFKKSNQSVLQFVDYMEDFGISAYDVIKSMENIKFENVYDIYRKVLKGTEGSRKPLEKLGKTPNYSSAVREYEQALRSVEQLLPMIEPGKIKRGKHYEDTIMAMFHTSPLWEVPEEEGGKPKYITGGRGGMDPEAQKKRIQNINMNLREYLQEVSELYKAGQELTPQMMRRKEKLKLPQGISTLSSLGPPEAQAASYEEYRPQAFLPEEQQYLKALKSTSIKLYSQKLLEQAPFGEFGRMGRNIANVTGAMGSMAPLGAEEVRGLPGLTSQFPSLKTTKERDIIAAGRYGEAGYGFNVLAELKHTAGTFEDQIIISGKLADALTQAVSNLVKPSREGRLSAPLGSRGDVTSMEAKTVRDVTDKDIQDASRKFMEILGIPEKYKRDADKALIEQVRTATTTNIGEDVGVQKGKLIEVFMSNFARKFVTRYGTKGVSVTAAGPEGLGTAEIPKSMGELAKELLEFIEADKELMKKASRFSAPGIKEEGFTTLKGDLAASGNKFMLNLFSDVTNKMAKGLGVESEIEKQAKIYENFTKIISRAFDTKTLPKDIAGIAELKDLYSQKIGPEGLATKKPIEIRISSSGVAKRGLQAEFLESIMGNIIATGKGGETTVQPVIPSGIMKELLGTGEQKGMLSKYSEALGYTGAQKPKADIKKDLLDKYLLEGKDSKEAEILAEKGAALEAMSSYYTKIKDEYGEAARSIVGPKFVQIVEEPHQTEGWSPKDVEALSKGGKLNVPAISAYSTIFGEQSALMEQIKGPGGKTFESKKQFEYIKALEAFNTSKEGKELSEKLKEASRPVELEELRPFTERTGTFFDEQDVKRNLKDTILDIEKYTTALTVQIPKGKGKQKGQLEREDFYIPGPLARQTYPEELIAGEVGMDKIARRLQNVINSALKVERSVGGAGGMIADKDIGELDSIIRDGVFKLLKESRDPGTDDTRRQQIAEQLFKGLEDVPVEKAYIFESKGKYAEGITEQTYVNEFFENFRSEYEEKGKSLGDVYKLSINRMADILKGPGEGSTLEGTPSRLEKVVGKGDINKVKELAKDLGLDVASEDDLDKSLAELNKAKIAYMKTLTDSILGKKGAIAGTAFLRKTPTVMAKAVSAVTDKTSELKDFSEQLKIIGNTFEEFSSEIPGLETLDEMSMVINDIRKEHAKSIEKYKELGLPVLGQHELGVPKHLAKKIPVTFEKKYRATEDTGLFPLEQPKKIEGNLAQMLGYRETLERGLKQTPTDYQDEIRKHIKEELQPFIESVRYPFTGVSSVQPYKAKILPPTKTAEGRDTSKYALAVPGIPEMRLSGKEGFDEQIKQLKAMGKAAFDLREKIREEAETTGSIMPEDKIKRLGDLIDTLNKAISDVIPKYVAVQQKLDFDGDMIQIHSGVLADARGDIEKHYKSITEYTKGMGTSAQAWRDVWTSGETTPSTSKEYPLADIMSEFEKKWPSKEGYEFLKRPELTEKLDYISPQKQLGFLGMAKVSGEAEAGSPEVLQAIGDTLKNIVEGAITEPGPREQILKNIDENIAAGRKTPDELLKGIEGLDKTFSTDLSKLVTAGIKDRLYEQKYSDAIVAQLFKLHTGQQTEGIYRLHRVAERRIGFGPGMADPTAKGYKASPEFTKRWPVELKVFGGIAPESEIHTFINELERFATQKGMDVKHAGARPVAGEIADSLARGTEGVEMLIGELGKAITDKESEYKQLSEFSEASRSAIESRLGKMPTAEIMSDVSAISEARGLPTPEIKDRKQAMEEAIKLIGFEGFLRELALQIEEDAVNAYVSYLESLAPRARGREMKHKKGMDLREFAKEQIQWKMSKEGPGISTAAILGETDPLYSYRAFGATQGSLADKYRRTSLQAVEIPKELSATGLEAGGIKAKEAKSLEKDYRNAQEISRSIQRTLQEVNQIKGRGTYNELVISTLENIYKDQTSLEAILSKLQTEGYPIGEAPGIETIGERMFAGAPQIPSITKDIIAPVGEGLESAGWVLDSMKRKVDEYSQLAGVSPLGPEVKRSIKYGSTGELFAKKAREKFKEADYEDEELRGQDIDEYVKNMLEKASAVAQMDKVIATLKTKVKERDFIARLLPSESDLGKMVKSQIESDITKPARNLITEQSRRLPSGGKGEPFSFGMEDQPQKPGMPAGGGVGGVGRERLISGGEGGPAVDVFVVGVAEGIGLTFTSAGTMQSQIDVAKAGTSKTDLDKLAQELNRLHEQSTGVIKTMRATYEDTFRASALSGGGSFGYKGGTFEGPEFEKEQIKAVKSKMRGRDTVGPRVEASAFYGTALHKEIQDLEKKKLEKQTGGGKTFDVERFVELQDAVGGYITGHVDMIEQRFDETGEVVDQKIVDIKTVSEGMVKRFRDVGLTKFKDLGKLEGADALTNYDIKKLNEVASQINLYIKAVAEANGVAEDSLKGEAWFYDRDDIKNMAKIEFDFDPKRLDRDMKVVNEARESILKDYGSQGFAEAQHRLDLTRAEQKRKMGKPTLSSKEWESFSDLSSKYWGKMKGQTEWSPDSREDDLTFPKVARSYSQRARRQRFSDYDIPKAPVSGEAVLDVFENLQTWHESAKQYAMDYKGIGFDTADFEKTPPQIKQMLGEVKTTGPKGTEFHELLSDLQESEYITGPEMAKAWRYYRIAVGDFFLAEAERASKMEEEFKKAGKPAQAGAEYGKMRSALNNMKKFIEKGLGKATDIYTSKRRYVRPDIAQELGLYLDPKQLLERSQGPLETPKLKGIFEKRLVGDVTKGEKLTAPIEKVRGVVKDLSGADDAMIDLLTDAEKFSRMGAEAQEAWNLDEVAEGVIKLRAALQSFLRFKFQEGEDLVERKNLQDTLKLLKNIEAAYTPFRGKRDRTPDWGEMGLSKVPSILPPKEQEAMHMRNLQRVREYYTRTEPEGGPKSGERYTYQAKVTGEMGDVVKSTAYDFRKLGDAVNFAGEKVGFFKEKQRDLMEFIQGGNRSFNAAIMRAVRWGAASKIVYGGWQKIWDSLGVLAEIETGIAKLRMVMSPLETDFDMLGDSAVKFAKQYGVSIQSVLDGMKIFAQQGLSQEEVIDRTRVATLAANVTTLGAKEATEALTAAMKVYGTEGQTALRFLDSWSEVEARHAITAGDMANAIKKAASAAKNAGFTFDELNGIIAGIGAVTRQSGREIGTSMRFIFRRLSSEKAPKELGKLNIPVMTGGAELRSGFDILNDLAGAWKDLTSAEKMSIAQSIGGTRQYNSLLVLMDNWKEATEAIRHSINSKGSAERRNLELMKTYAKQLEQTKTAAVEVQMAFGKIVLPAFKTGLTVIKTALEMFSAIPGPVKAAMAAVAAFFTFMAKGDELIQQGFSFALGGKSKLSQIVKGFHDEFRVSGFEVLGRGAGEAWTKGLKTVSKYSDKGTEKGERLKDFHSALGKTKFLLMEAGQGWNRFIGDIVVGGGDLADSVDRTVQKIGKGMQKIGTGPASFKTFKTLVDTLKTGAITPGGALKTGLGFGVYAAGEGMEKVSEMVIGGMGDLLGTGGRDMLSSWASANTGVVKSLLPLIATLGGLYFTIDKAGDYFSKITKNAKDYEQSMYGVRRASDAQMASIQTSIGDYDKLAESVKEYNKLQDPKVVSRRKELGTYQSPLLKMGEVLKESVKYANRLAETNINLVAGYDAVGNAILKNVESYKQFSEISKKVAKEERARTEVGIAGRFAYDITEKGGSEKWKSGVKKVLKELPLGFGKLAADLVKVSPAKAVDEITKELNKLLTIKNKFPMSTAVDEDVKRLQKSLKEARGLFNEMYIGFKETLSKIDVEGLDKSVVADIFSSKELRKGFETLLGGESRFKQIKGLEVEDIIGAEVLKGISPKFASYVDAAAALTKARLQSSIEDGIAGVEPVKELHAGQEYLATFPEVFGKKDGSAMAGNQAIITWKKNIDGVYEAVATYFNKKTLKIETMAFDKETAKLVDAVFPAQRLQDAVQNNVEQFNEFVAGASAGLRGISAKDFKRDFSLGERFFGEVPTTTVLQGSKGYTPFGGYGESPFQEGWAEDIKKNFFEPMKEYRFKIEKFEKLRAEGLEAGKTVIDPATTEAISDLQTVLKNNQVVLQYKAVWIDMTKAMAESMRVMRESMAIEKERIATVKVVSGQLAGISEDLIADLNLGIRQPEKLTAHQVALKESPEYKTGAALYKDLERLRKTVIENNEGFVKAQAAIKNIKEYSEAFGVALQPAELSKFAEKVAILGDKGAAAIVLSTDKVVENTATTNKKLEDILVALGDPKQTDAYFAQQTKSAVTSSDKLKALENLATRRRHEQNAGNTDMVIVANKQIDVLSKSLAQQVGLSKAVEMVGDNTTLLKKDFKKEEFFQRAMPLPQKELYSLMRQRLTGDEIKTKKSVPDEAYDLSILTPAFFGNKKVAERMSAIEKDSKGLYDLQKESSSKDILSSKTMQKAQVAASVYYALNKKYSNEAIKKYDEQITVLESRAQMEATTGDMNTREARTRPIVQELEAIKEARGQEQGMADMYGMVRNFSALGLGATTLARVFGMTEKQIKGMGVGAMTTYLAFQLLAKVTGREVPDSVKEFGKSVKEVGKSVMTKGSFEEISLAAKSGFKRTAGAMAADVEKYRKANVKEGEEALGGLDVDKLQASFEKASQSMLDRDRKLGEYKAIGPDYKKYAELYEKQMAERVEEYTRSGFAGANYQDLLAKQGKEMFKHMKQYDYEMQDLLLEKFPIAGGGKDYYKDVKEMYSESVKGSGREKYFEGRTENRLSQQFIKLLITSLATTMAGVMIDQKATDYNTRYAQAEDQAKEMFKVYEKHPEMADEIFKEYFSKAREAAKQGLIPTESVERAIDTIKGYTTVNDSLSESLGTGHSKLKAIDEVFKVLNDALSSTQVAIGELGRSFNAMAKSLQDLSAIEFAGSLAGVKEYREDTAKLFGGGHPAARVAVSVAQEREASGVGIKLSHMKSTKYDVQEAALRAQQMRGEGGPEIYRQIQDVSEQRRRDEEAYKQAEANKKLLAQASIYEKQIERLGMLANEVDLSADMKMEIENLQKSLADMLAKASDEISQTDALKLLETGKKEKLITPEEYETEKAKVMAAGPTQYKGIQLSDFAKLRESISEISKAANEKAAEDMKKIAENTQKLTETLESGKIATEAAAQTAELKKQSDLLKQLTSQMAEVTFIVAEPTKKQLGGVVAGTGRGDKYPHMLEAGEYVVRSDSAKKLGYGFLDQLNQGNVAFAANGGPVGMMGDLAASEIYSGPSDDNTEILNQVKLQTSTLGEVAAATKNIKVKEGVSELSKESTSQAANEQLKMVVDNTSKLNEGMDSIGMNLDISSVVDVLTTGLDKLATILGKIDTEIVNQTNALKQKTESKETVKSAATTPAFKPLSQRAKEYVGSVWDEKAIGGRIFGEGGPKADKVPAMLSHGEYVIKTASAKRLGYDALEHMNQKGTIPGFAEGGMPEENKYIKAVKQMKAIGMSKEDIAAELGGIKKPFVDPTFVIAGGATGLTRGLAAGALSAGRSVVSPGAMEYLKDLVAPGPAFAYAGGGKLTEKELIAKKLMKKTKIGKKLSDRKKMLEQALNFADGGISPSKNKFLEMARSRGMPEEEINAELGGIEQPLIEPADIIGLGFGASKLLLGLGKGVIKQAAKKPKTYEELLKIVYPEKAGVKGVVEKFKMDKAWKQAQKKWSKEAPISTEQQAMSELSSASRRMLEQAKIPSANDILKVVETTKAPTNRAYELGKMMHENPAIRKSLKAARKDFDAKTAAFGPTKELSSEALSDYTVHAFKGQFFREADEFAEALANPSAKSSAAAIAREFLEGKRNIADFAFAEGGKVRYFSDYGLKPGEIYSLEEMERTEEEYKKIERKVKEISKVPAGKTPETKAKLPLLKKIEAGKIPSVAPQPTAEEIKKAGPDFNSPYYSGPDIPLYTKPPKAKPKNVIIPGGVDGKLVGPDFFAKQSSQASVASFAMSMLGKGLDYPIKALDKLIGGEFYQPEIYYPGDDKNVVPMGTSEALAKAKSFSGSNVPVKDLDNIAKGIMDVSGKSKAETNKEDWAIRTAEDAISKMKKSFTTEEYDKHISSFYSDNVLKQMFTQYIEQFGKDGHKQAMMDLNLSSPDPHIFGGRKFGDKGPIRKRYNPFQAKLAMDQGKYEAKELKRQWDLAKDKQTVEEARKKGNRDDALIQYQATYDPLGKFITKDMLGAVVPQTGHAASDDPAYAKLMEEQGNKRKKLLDNLTTATPGSEEAQKIQAALKALDNLAQLDRSKKDFKQQYNNKYKEYEKIMTGGIFSKGVVGIKTITPDSELYNSLQSQEKQYVQMHLRAKSLWDNYEDLLQEKYKKQGLDYKGKDKESYQKELKNRRDDIMRQLLYTNTILAKIRTGEGYTDLKGLPKYRDHDGTIRSFRDRWGKLQPRPLTSLARNLDRNIVQQYKQEQFDSKLAGTLKGTGYTPEDVYKPGFSMEYLKELEGKWTERGKRKLTKKAQSDPWISQPKPYEKTIPKDRKELQNIREYYINKKKKEEEEKKSFFHYDEPISNRGVFWALRKIFGKADGGQVNSMRVMHAGGLINKTGPVFAQKGEIIYPKGFAEGGMAKGEVSKLLENKLPSLKNLVIKIDTSELKALLGQELKVEDVELKVEDVELKVEDKVFTVEDRVFTVEDKIFEVENIELKVEDKIFPVEDKVFQVEDAVLEVDATAIKIDAETVVSEISAAVREAVSNITVTAEVSGGAVGADEFANIAEAMNNVNDKIITLNNEMESKIKMLGNVSEDAIMNKVEGMINNSINDVTLDIRGTDSYVDSLRSEVQREKDLNNFRVSEIDRKIGEIYNIIV